MEEVYNALNVIKEECIKNNGNCDKCCLGNNNGTCGIYDKDPKDWNITKPTLKILL